MKALAVVALLGLTVPAQANSDQIIDDVLSTIARFAHHHRHRCCPPPPEYLDGPPPYEEPPPVEAPGPLPEPGPNGTNAGHEILLWLDRQGIHDAFVTGRRDQDCPHPSQAFFGGWGVVIKQGQNGKPTSGVVCLDGGHISMTLDR